MKNKVISFIILCISLFFLSFVFMSIKGKTYEVEIDNHDFSNYTINDIQTFQEGNSVTLIDKKIEDGILKLKYRALSKGKTIVDIQTDEYYNYIRLFVHDFKIITYDDFFGDSNGDEVIAISFVIIILYILILICITFKKSMKENLYQYKNMYYLGLIIFLSFAFIYHFLNIFNYHGLLETLNKIISSYNLLSYLILPIGVITFIFVSISNIRLMIKEGFSVQNMLGIILGILVVIITLLPEFIYRFTYSDIFINIHNISSVEYHIYTFFETLIYSFVAYLECILLSVIILSVKAARRIPEFNKDYIIILGCMIFKDGSIPNLLKSRIDRAIEFRNMQYDKTKKDLIFITSGGKGDNEPIAEATAMKNYLNEKGINNVIVEDKSKNTYENFEFSNKKIKKGNIAFSTTNYHVFRAGVEASNLGLKVEGIGARTKSYFWINAFIREFIATLFYEKKKHILIFSLLLILNIIMIRIIYISNVL